MAKTKLNIIKPVLGVTGMSDGDLLQRLNKVHDGMSNNPAYPSPPVDMPGFKAAIDAYNAAVTATLEGGKATTVERDKRRNDVVLLLRLLGHYVEATCKNNMTTFLSSGFVAAAPVQRTPAQPVTTPLIVSVDQGSPGQLLVKFKPVAKARNYEIRYGAVPTTAGAGTSWIPVLVPSSKPPAPINNLTAGVSYQFQVRAFGTLGFSDWSASAGRMAI